MEKLLLDVCCGPDATHALEHFGQVYEVSLLFSGSNIHPPEEFALRLEQVKKVAGRWGVRLHVSEYDPRAWLRFVKGLENEPEGGARCARCFEFRLGLLAARARDLDIPNISTTLTVSPKKDAALVNRLGKEIAERAGIRWVEAVLRKQGGFNRSLELSRELGLYRQDYCGCRFSLSSQ